MSYIAENFRGEAFSVHYFREPKKFGQERGDYQDFPSKFFVSHCRKTLGEHFTVALVSGIENVWIKGEGEYQDFPSKFFWSLIAKIFRRGILY